MSRNKGTFNFAANFEVLTKAPIDARLVVSAKEDLINPSIWQDGDSLVWLYKGIVVSVTSDPVTENNGLYFLTDETQYTDYNYWIKIGTSTPIDASGTSWSSFQINNDASGVLLVDVSGNLEIINPNDGDLADVSVGSLYIDGSLKIDNLSGPLYVQDGNVYVGAPVTILAYDGSILGDDTTTEFPINHNLNTIKQNVMVWEDNGDQIFPAVTRGLNTDTISFLTPPLTGAIYYVNIIGF